MINQFLWIFLRVVIHTRFSTEIYNKFVVFTKLTLVWFLKSGQSSCFCAIDHDVVLCFGFVSCLPPLHVMCLMLYFECVAH